MGANRASIVQIGKIFETNFCGSLEIISVEAKRATVRFLKTGYVREANKCDILHGKVKDLMFPSIYGVAFIGEGAYQPKDNLVNYMRWNDMLRRCYSAGDPKFINYENHSVNEDWFNFQVYMDWATVQEGNGTKGWQLDKDLLKPKNLMYGPDCCCFLPKEINMALICDRLDKNVLGTGVDFNEKLGKYVARTKLVHKASRYIGLFDTAVEAADAYLIHKTEYIKHLAIKYKSDLEDGVYKALIEWKPCLRRSL